MVYDMVYLMNFSIMAATFIDIDMTYCLSIACAWAMKTYLLNKIEFACSFHSGPFDNLLPKRVPAK